MDDEDIVNVKISNRCRMKLIDEVFYSLDEKHQDLLTNSYFGHLLCLRKIKLASQLVHQLILRSISTSKENEVFIKVGDKLARFGLQEFTLVTGLKAGDLENEDPKLGQNCRLVKERFKRSNGKIKRGLLLQVFKRCKHKNDKYKLGLLVILMYVVLAAEENTFVNPWLFYLVDDLDRFNNYSWGRKSYEYTIKVFKRNLGDMLKGYTTSQRYPYSLHGFPFAIMIEVHCTLNPTDDELLEPFWKESGPFDSEADPKLEKVASKDEGEKDSESDDAQSSFTRPQCPKTSDRPSMSSHLHSSKTARRPPPSYDYITHIIKQEIRGVEERHRGEMSDRFDRVERKIDLFLQLAGQGGVQSERSKFDDRAFSKGNQQNKETRERDETLEIDFAT
ncbi:Hypothetical predicted protein [Olea europaea subsp. europaea]|uniref:DUF1985 domain-containing protein n=1 Tax=Olea europaea subsp. europaea TaxID=158383 RepID=A0A8S0RIC3_OLEEU|nr:Hypothetical predicted protein [Olea europaea subsp. europaea]